MTALARAACPNPWEEIKYPIDSFGFTVVDPLIRSAYDGKVKSSPIL